MKKYPFSKKAVSILLATALIVTPLASTFPVGTSIVSAITLSEQEKTEIKELVESIAPVFYATTRDELEEDLNRIRDDHGEDIKAVLGGTTFEKLIQFYVALDGTTKTKLVGLSVDNLTELDMDEFMKETIQETVDENQNAKDVQDNIKDATGFTFQDIFDMKSRLDSELGLTPFEKESLKERLAAAALLSTDDPVDNSDELTELVSRLGNIYDRMSDTAKDLIQDTRTNLLDDTNTIDWSYVLWDEPTPAPTTPGDTGGSGPSTPPSDDNQTDDQDQTEEEVPSVDVGEDAQTVEEVVREDGRSSRVVTVDPEKLSQSIQEAENVERVRLSVETAKGEVAEVRVPVQAFTAVSERNENAQVEIATNEASYRLPVREVNVENLARDLGVESADDVSISVEISETEDTSNSVANNNLTSVAPIMEFKVSASSGDKRIEMTRFSSFVEREIVGAADFNPRNSTAVQLMDDGSFRAVPTTFNGNRAVFRSLTNSRYTVVENDKTFTDIEEVRDWAGEEIEKLASKYIIQGFNEDEFKPMGDTTRGQLVALLTRALGLTTDSEYGEKFTDVNATHTFAPELTAALEAGIIEGYTDGSFKPEDVVSREQAAAMFARALRHIGFDDNSLDDKELSYFVDSTSVNDRFKDDVELLLQAEIMVGGTDQNFRPENINNRAQTAKVLDNFLKFIKFIN